MNALATFLMLPCLAAIPAEPPVDQHAPGFLGVRMIEEGGSVKLTAVIEDSAAERAGLKENDVLKKIGDWEVDNLERLRETIIALRPGTKVPITVQRKDKTLTVTIRIMAKP